MIKDLLILGVVVFATCLAGLFAIHLASGASSLEQRLNKLELELNKCP